MFVNQPNAQPNPTVSSFSNTASNREEVVIDFLHYWRSIMLHKWGIIALAVIITVWAAAMTMVVTPAYTATSTMLIESKEAKVLSIEEIYSLDSNNKEYYLTQFEILKSRSIAEKVVDFLNLMDDSEFSAQEEDKSLIAKFFPAFSIYDWLPFLEQPTETSAERLAYIKRQQVIDNVASRISISPVRNTQLVKISFTSESPEMAALVANTIPSVYISSHLEAKLGMTNKATTWLSERRLVLRDTLSVAEKKLHQFNEDNGLVDVSGVEGLASQNLNQLTAQLTDARHKLGQAESIYKQVKRGSYTSFGSLPEVLNHSVIQDIQRVEESAQRKVSELGRRYGPKHPKMIAAQAELTSVRSNKYTQIGTLVEGIENEYTVAANNVESLEKLLSSAKQSYQKISRKATEHNELQREVDVNRELYNTFLKRYTETSETGGFSQANARVTDSAMVPVSPSKPNKKLIVVMAFVVSMMTGILLAFLYEALNNGVRSVSDVENKLSSRMLGMLPSVPHRKADRLNTYAFFENTSLAFQEALRSLRTSLVLSNIETPFKIMTVTSTAPFEGKSTVASNLAFALGKMEKVLLIDADLRKPSLGGMFNLPSYTPGLTNLIMGGSGVKECIVRDERGGIDIMPAGVMTSNPQELLSSKRLEKILEVLSSKYDRIILDSAPIQAVGDPLLLSNLSDSVLYVVKADSVSVEAVKRGLGRLLQMGARVEGVVLNQVNMKRMAGYGGYYYGYGNVSEPPVKAAHTKRTEAA